MLMKPRWSPDEALYHCLECHDETSGWAPRYCIGVGTQRGTAPAGEKVEPCGRHMTHPPHPFVVRCVCFETNPVSAKRRERENIRREARKKK